MNATMVLSLMGGLGLFLFGIKTMGDGLETAAGNRMKHLLEILTFYQRFWSGFIDQPRI